MGETLRVLRHFLALRLAPAPRSRAALERRQARRLRRFLADAVARSPFYRGRPPELAALPVMTKAGHIAHFAALNRAGITLDAATALARRAEEERDFRPELPGGVTAGLSSGTSGARHVFLAGAEDRHRWAGHMLARLLSAESLRRVCNPLAAPLRIALFLRANSNLYATVSGRRIRLDHFDLTRPFDDLLRDLAARPPHILVAPATVLAEIARRERAAPTGLRPRQVFSAAEVLDSRDRAAISATFGVPVGEIYQATEGFLGSSCPAGRVHLHEETLHVEPQWLDAERTRFEPLITDFSRTTQWFIRHQLTDVLRIRREPCPCGRVTLCLEAIEGRREDVLQLAGLGGAPTPVFPDSVRQALYAMPDPPMAWRVWQRGPVWEIHLPPSESARGPAVQSALQRLVDNLGLARPAFSFPQWREAEPGAKERRIRRVEDPA